MSVDDPINLTGISALVSYDGADPIDELEKKIIGDGAAADDEEDDDIEAYEKELKQIGGALESMRPSRDESDDESDDGAEAKTSDMLRTAEETRYVPRGDTLLGRMTEEEKKQKILKSVLDGSDDVSFNVEREVREDTKAALLEQIDILMTSLKDGGSDLSRIPEVGPDSPMRTINDVHKILLRKNDRLRCRDLAEDSLLSVAKALEWCFDGKKSYPGGMRPDLTGWSSHVGVKLRRMRYDTSTFTSDIMQSYNFGYGTRILIELIPSLFIYNSVRKRQTNDNLVTNAEMSNAFGVIRDADSPDAD